MREIVVSVFGSGRDREDEAVCALAEQVGRALAQAGFTLANGGYGGTMRAAARGAAQAGGKVIGVTCSAFKSHANEYVTREVRTDSLKERLHNLVKAGQAYVVLPGGTGTLLELASVWELKNKGFLDATRPIVLVGDFWKPVVNLMATEDPKCARSIEMADGPDHAVEIIRRALSV